MQSRRRVSRSRPRLKEIGLRNFKTFGNDIQLAPMSRITLIYGPNSGGKSSIIQALLLLKQSEGSLPRGAVLAPQGEYVDLAGFRAMVHRHDEDQRVGINVKLSNTPEEEFGVDLTFGKDSLHDTDLPALNEVGYELKQNSATQFAIRLQLNPDAMPQNEETATFKWAEKETSLASYGQFIHKLLTSRDAQSFRSPRRYNFASRIGRQRYPEMISLLEERDALIEPMMAILEDISFLATASILPSFMYVDESTEQHESTEVIAFRDYLQHFRFEFNSFTDDFRTLLGELSYLGPILDDPKRFYNSLGGRRSTVGKRGEYTFDIISYDNGVRDRVNSWFHTFDIPYQIKDMRNVAASELTGILSAMPLEDTRTNTIVTPVDVGFGISQILPVIVEGVAGTSSVVCVDQPEVHLHPKLQAEIADLMIGCDDKQWIVETHSELLVRRIIRRIAEGKVKPSDVSVLYVDPPSSSNSGTGSTIKVLEIEEGGRFSSATPWPQGFFEDSYREMMLAMQAGG